MDINKIININIECAYENGKVDMAEHILHLISSANLLEPLSGLDMRKAINSVWIHCQHVISESL